MRILLTHHLTPDDPDNGSEMIRLGDGLRLAGHEVRCLAADLPFDLPRFHAPPGGGLTFRDLSERQIAQYRETFRRAMDELVLAVDPQVIHCQHVWLHGHLALETGVPCVLTAWGPELEVCDGDPRYRRFVREAADSAGRIVVSDEALRRRVAAVCRDGQSRIVVLPDNAARIAATVEIYRAVLDERFRRGVDPPLGS